MPTNFYLNSICLSKKRVSKDVIHYDLIKVTCGDLS